MHDERINLRKNKSRIEKVTLIILLFALGATFFASNALCPMLGDDYVYGKLGTSATSLEQLIEVMQSKWNPGQIRLGNILCIIFMFCDGGRGILFNICNTVVFVSTLVALAKCVFGEVSPGRVGIISATLLFIFCPAYIETYLWESGAFNYLWGACFLSIFLACYMKMNEELKTLRGNVICGITAATLAAWTHEALAFPLFFALIITAILNNKERHKAILCLVPVAAIVVLYLLSAPGMYQRAGGERLYAVVFNSGMAWLKVFLLPFLILCVCAWVRRKDFCVTRAGMMTWLVIGSIGLYLFSAGKWTWGEEGPAYYPKFIAAVAVLLMMRPWLQMHSQKLAWLVILGVALFFSYQLSFLYGIHLVHKQAEGALASSNVIGVTYEVKDKQLPWILRDSLPSVVGGFTYRNYNSYHNTSNATVIVNRNIVARESYDSMGIFDDTKIRFTRAGEYVVVQLPCCWMGMDAAFSSHCQALNSKTNRKIYFSIKEVPEWTDNVGAYCRRRFPISSWAKDYINGRHYMMFKIPASIDYNEMHLPIYNVKTSEKRIVRVFLEPGFATDIDDTHNQVQMDR